MSFKRLIWDRSFCNPGYCLSISATPIFWQQLTHFICLHVSVLRQSHSHRSGYQALLYALEQSQSGSHLEIDGSITSPDAHSPSLGCVDEQASQYWHR